jgi:hypothetical protein
MFSCLLGVAAVLLAAAPVPRPEPLPLPKFPPPEVVFAQASQQGGAVQLRFFLPVPEPKSVFREVELGGRKLVEQVVTTGYSRWRQVELAADGKRVRAFDVEGKEVAPTRLLELLAKPSPVVLFKVVQNEGPDPHYLRVLRPGTVVLQAPFEPFNPPPQRD